MSPEQFKQWAASDEGKAVQPYLDYYARVRVETFRKNHPQGDELGPHLDAIEKRIAEKDAALAHEQRKHAVYRQCVDAGIPPELMEGFDLADEQNVTTKIETLQAAILEKQKQDNIRDIGANAHKPGGGLAPDSIKRDFFAEAARRNNLMT